LGKKADRYGKREEQKFLLENLFLSVFYTWSENERE
jgi:hypothetical protein